MDAVVWSLLAIVVLACLILLPFLVIRLRHEPDVGAAWHRMPANAQVLIVLGAEVLFVVLLEVAVAEALRSVGLLPDELAPSAALIVTDVNLVLMCAVWSALGSVDCERGGSELPGPILREWSRVVFTTHRLSFHLFGLGRNGQSLFPVSPPFAKRRRPFPMYWMIATTKNGTSSASPM